MDKDKITIAIKNIDSAMSLVKATRQEHEILIQSIKDIVDLANAFFKEEKKEENK